jgi:hypothetical protein
MWLAQAKNLFQLLLEKKKNTITLSTSNTTIQVDNHQFWKPPTTQQ